MPGLTSEGFDRRLVTEIQSDQAGAIRGAISPTLDTSEESLPGQYIGVNANSAGLVWELAQAIYAAQDIEQATGDALTALCARSGTIRTAETYSYDFLDLDLDADTYAPGALVVHVAGDPTARFANQLEVVSAGGVVSAVRMVAEEPGPVRANAGTLTTIVPVEGFNGVTDPEDAVVGSFEESDAALRRRHADELARKGSASTAAIKSRLLLDVADVTSAHVVENDSDVTDANGVPPGYVAAYVTGGTDADVAATILDAKAAGIGTYGNTTITVTDSQGVDVAVSFSRPVDTNVYVIVTLTALAGQYVGDAKVKDAIIAWGDALGTGRDVSYSRALSTIDQLGGVVDVSDLRLGFASDPTGAATLVITPSQAADFDTSRIVVNSTLVAAAP